MKPRDHQRDRAEGEKSQGPGWNSQTSLGFRHSQENEHESKIGEDSRQPKKEREVDTNFLTPFLLSQKVDAAQIICGQRRMIKIPAVLISPFQAVRA